MWHVTGDIWQVTCDMLWAVNILSKFQLSVCDLWYFEDLEEKDDLLSQSVMKLFVRQHRLHRVR